MSLGPKVFFWRGRFKMLNMSNFRHWCQFIKSKICSSKLKNFFSFSTQIDSERVALKFQNFTKCTKCVSNLGIGILKQLKSKTILVLGKLTPMTISWLGFWISPSKARPKGRIVVKIELRNNTNPCNRLIQFVAR